MGKKKSIIFLNLFYLSLFVISFCLIVFQSPSATTSDTVSIQYIIDNYSSLVTTKHSAVIYQKTKDSYSPFGTIAENMTIPLEKVTSFSQESTYFKVKNSNFYVYYEDVAPGKKQMINNLPIGYIPYNLEIVTKNPFSIYDQNNRTLTIQDTMTFSVEYLWDDGYVILWNDTYYKIAKSDVLHEEKINSYTEDVAKEIAVLNYHFFYDKETETCNEEICLDIDKFDEQLKYLQDNHYNVLDMHTFLLWKKNQVRLPKKSVLLTVDDGALGTDTHLIKLLEKYKMHGTLFLITAWWKKENYVSDYLDVESHGNNLHIDGYCDGVTRGAKGLCISTDELLNDLKKSIKKLDQPIAFCYPFYAYDNRFKKAVKDAGFSLAFIGGNRKAKQNDDNYAIPRYIIGSKITLNQFIHLISNE